MKKKRIFLTAIIGIALIFNPLSLLIIGISLACISNCNPDIGENVQHVDWLPKEATNVSYYKTYSNTFYEFDIPENGFKKWASDWGFKKIIEPKSICRYTMMTLKPPKPKSNVWTEEDVAARIYFQDKVIQTIIKKGYYYSSPPQGNGGGTWIAYDLDKGRAYYHSCPR